MLSWDEIRKNAIEFSNEWQHENRENAEAKTFWDQFFNIFGISRRRVASFEYQVKILNSNQRGYIDLFWKRVLIVEHKSRGQNLAKAFQQIIDYFPGIKEEDLPKYILVSDFQRFRLYDLDEDSFHEFELNDLYMNVHLFGFILGYPKQQYKDEDPVNIRAAELMGSLHESLEANGYKGHPLEVFLVRIMFCLFAEDTGIFNKDQFEHYIKLKTNKNGSDLGMHLAYLFQFLDTHLDKRPDNLEEDINAFAYVNGSLFQEVLPLPSFNEEMRNQLIKCCEFDWSYVSPAIFGSMFQVVMNPKMRRSIGGHYTSEKNILKAVNSLFIEELKAEFREKRNCVVDLHQMLQKLRNITVFDPACGCGNFLLICYRELRLLEIDIFKQIKKLMKNEVLFDTIRSEDILDVDIMYGIEIEEFPVRIAEVALWLTDHQMNIKFSQELNCLIKRIPLQKSPNIVHENALRFDWETLIPKHKLSYIVSNPPFVAKNRRNKNQNNDMSLICSNIRGYQNLDYVCAWYFKAADYIKGSNIKVAYVSTNSITQGEQVGILWDFLLKRGINIDFAHRTFKWSNEGKTVAQVYVVIIGFSATTPRPKFIFEYQTPTSEPIKIVVKKNINPYLIDQDNLLIKNRRKPLCNVPRITFGSMPNDGGHLLFTNQEKQEFLEREPSAEKYFRPLISGRELLNNQQRWCLWLVDISPRELDDLKEVLKRIENVREYRLASKRATTVELAKTPYMFGEIRQPQSSYIAIPLTSSEKRRYIPMVFFSQYDIASNSCSIIPNANLFHYGVLMSTMHMSWVRQVCGRLKSDYRYSNKLVYNNFPWPFSSFKKSVKLVECLAQKILDTRLLFPDDSLANLYDPLLMPKALLVAHKELDTAVDKCYSEKTFESELERMEFLFELYKTYVTKSSRP